MKEERGLLIGGRVLSGTEWVRRISDKKAWWDKGERGTRERRPLMNLIVGHWTAGEAGAKSFDDDGMTVQHVMERRNISVGVHFVIGAGPYNGEAYVWQVADPGETACIHVSKGWINARSIGIEVVSCGVPGKTNARNRPSRVVNYLGSNRRVVDFYPGQIAAWKHLVDTLTGKSLPTGIEIPRDVPVGLDGKLLTRRMTHAEARTFTGVIEHFHMPDTNKIDAATLLVDPLKIHGYSLKKVG